MKKIKDLCNKRGNCTLDGTECVPGESDCSYTQCLTKLLWGLSTECFQEHALKALEEFLQPEEEKFLCIKAESKECTRNCKHGVPHTPYKIFFEGNGIYCNERADHCPSVDDHVICFSYGGDDK